MKTTKAGISSEAPTVLVQPLPPKDIAEEFLASEEAKYIKAWDSEDYRKFSPGERSAPVFLETATPNKGDTVVDWGCGSGKGSKVLYDAGLDVTMLDFAHNCLDGNIRDLASDNENLRFIQQDLSEPCNYPSTYGFCTDVMEHIPTDQVDMVLDNIINSSQNVFFEISTVEDHFGNHPDIKGDGERVHLHLTVKPYQWWLEKFVEKQVIIHMSEVLEDRVVFYLTGWSQQALDFNNATLNTDVETIKSNIKANAKLGLQPARPGEPQPDLEIMLLAGGPSLNDYTDEIIEQRAKGMPLVTVNGSYHWAIMNGMKPSIQCMIDAREFNSRFVRPVLGPDPDHLVNDVPYMGCQYFLSSQCHPSAFEDLPKDQTYMWQVSIEDEILPVVEEAFGEINVDWFPCPGGSTVTLRALCLLQMLGFRKIHIYGFDSCVFDDQHHAYDQPENDNKLTQEIIVAKGTEWEKSFRVEGWQRYQAREFQLMAPRTLQDLQLDIKGDGLIEYIIWAEAQAAEMAA